MSKPIGLTILAGLLVVIGAVSQVEAGPQDGTLLVTWQPVLRPPASGPVTGYAVYADGKKVTDVDSPTGDHALIDIGKLIGLNPKSVTVSICNRLDSLCERRVFALIVCDCGLSVIAMLDALFAYIRKLEFHEMTFNVEYVNYLH